MRRYPFFLLLIGVLMVSPARAGQSPLEGRIVVDLLNKINRLDTEVQVMRGLLEEQEHRIAQLKKHQRELYVDLDQRMQVISAQENITALQKSTPSTEKATDQAIKKSANNTPHIGQSQVELNAYKKAFKWLKKGKYEQAVLALNRFIVHYPTSQYAGHAQYWIGEAYFVTAKFEQANQAFQAVINTYPDSPKVAGAMLKLGSGYIGKRQLVDARNIFNELMMRYPGSTSARMAEKKLKSID